jgi:hypothetical protein
LTRKLGTKTTCVPVAKNAPARLNCKFIRRTSCSKSSISNVMLMHINPCYPNMIISYVGVSKMSTYKHSSVLLHNALLVNMRQIVEQIVSQTFFKNTRLPVCTWNIKLHLQIASMTQIRIGTYYIKIFPVKDMTIYLYTYYPTC